MAKQLNVDLRFNADTSAAKAAIQDLQNALQNVAKTPGKVSSLFDDRDIKQASNSAMELQHHLSQAFNVDTGKLDLSRFSTSLKTSGKDIKDYYHQLVKIGPDGEQAFLQLARSISMADAPVTKINSTLREFGTTLQNTARWQISSSILHGFMGAVQSAYGYAKDLNRSLNDIRIVTGQNSDEMARFAVQANKAAKSLSATTTEYTKASLIYFQQGLSEEQVKERADITVKMANASGQSAEIVSDQLTSVWNNFAKGGENLEHFADVMVRLGADTASSSEEIASGLEKFAAVGEMVGLSYENAAAALATVTATTRESADTVGTAFKTIFARIQGLKLGETLEDGTDLNKYSEALATVGISIKDQNGQLKDMDNILAEMGAKWTTLSKDQQVALAQTVAGVRQYNQLAALMENWDFYEKNLESAKNADGALQEQADIYAESWEAASDRVRAAAEKIYSALLDDDFFIALLNGFEKVLETIGGMIDGFGGLKGVLTTVGSIFLTHYAKKMPEALNNLRQNLMVFTGQSQKVMLEMQEKTKQALMTSAAAPGAGDAYKIQAEGIITVTNMQEKLIKASQNMTTEEQAQYKARIQNVQAIYDEITALAKQSQETEKTVNTSRKKLIKAAEKNTNKTFGGYEKAEENVSFYEKKVIESVNTPGIEASEAFARYSEHLEEAKISAERLQEEIQQIAQAYGFTDEQVEKLIANQGKLSGEHQQQIKDAVNQVTQEYETQLTTRQKLDSLSTGLGSQTNEWKKVASEIKDNNKEVQNMRNSMLKYIQIAKDMAKQNGVAFDEKEINQFEKEIEDLKTDAEGCAKAFEKFYKAINKPIGDNIENLDADIEATENKLNSMHFNTEELSDFRNGVEEIADESVRLEILRENAQGLGEDMPEATFKASQAMTEFGSAIMAAYGVMSSIQGAISVFTDESSTGFEKLGAVISVLMSVMTAYNTIVQLTTTLTKAGTLATWAANTAKTVKTATEAGETAGIWANVTAWIAQQAAMAPVLVITLAIVAAMLILVGVIALVTAAFKAIQANSPEGKMKAAQEESAALTEELNKTKQAAEDLKKSFDDYKSIQDKLADCKKGTEEWNEALKENNDKVRELLGLYPELSTKTKKNEETGQLEKAVGIDENGVLTISDWAMEILINEANIQVGKAQLADSYGKQKVREQKIENLQYDLDREKTILNTTYGREKTGKTEQEVHSKGVEGYVSMKEDGTYYGYDFNWVDEAVSELINKYGETAAQHVSEIDGITQEQKESLAKVIDSELALKGAVDANTEATLLEKQSNVDNLMAGNEKYAASKDQDLIRAVIAENGFDTTNGFTVEQDFLKYDQGTKQEDGSRYFENDTQLKEAYMEALNDNAGITSGMSSRATEAFDAYLSAMNLDPNKLVSLERTKTGFEYKMEGQTEAQTVAKETVANTLVTDNVNKETRKYGDAITEQMESFETREQKELFAAAATGESGLLSQELLEKNNDEINNILESMNLSEKALEDLGFSAKDYGGNLEKARAAFEKHEKEIIKQEKAYRSLRKNGIDTLTAIANKAEGSAEKIADFSKGIGDSLGIENLQLSQDFISNNESLISDFLNGVEGKAEELRKAIALNDIKVKMGLDAENIQTELNGEMTSLQDIINGFPLEDIEVGASLNDSGYYDALQALLDSGQLTADQVNAILDTMGYEPTITWEELDVSNAVKDENSNTYTVEYVDTEGNTQTKVITAEQYSQADSDGKIKIPIINGDKTTYRGSPGGSTSIGGPKSTNPNGDGNGGGNGGGGNGGGSKPKVVQKKAPIKAKKASDEIERYHEIMKAIEDQERILERLSKAKDKAYGADKIKLIDKEIEALKRLNELDAEHLSQIKAQLKLDQQKAKGYGITFDESGRINNYDEIIQQKMNEWKAEQDAIQAEEIAYEEAKNAAGEDEEYDADGAIKLDIEQRKEASDEKYEEFKSAIDQYEETLTLFDDTADKIAEQFDQIAEKIIEKIDYQIEIKIEFNDFGLELLDFQLEKIGDKFNTFSEAIGITAQKASLLNSNIRIFSDGLGEFWSQYEAGSINLSQFVEEAKDKIPEVLDLMQEMLATDAEMLEYYGNAFDTAEEEFTEYLDLIDFGIDKLQSYKDMLSLIGKEANNDMLGVVLEAQYKSANDRLYASAAWYDTTKKEYDALYQRWLNEKDTMDPKELEMLETNLKVARTKMQEADQQRLADIQAVGESAQEILDNNLEKARKKLEEGLVGSSLEDYMTNLDRLSKKQEEYLTDTNKMYETNKLIRQAQLDMDKTENNRAKQQYNDYIKYIGQLQESEKLSSYELSIAQAKYDLLQAQIALEEAQEAKNQVRLTRDSEGNYGYVYTANEDKVASAEQAVADAENKLYNIGLEGAKNYQSKKAQILEEAVETFAAIEEKYQTGEIESEEEFNQKMLEAKEYYYGLLKDYDNLYYLALGTIQEESYDNTVDYELDSTKIFDTFATTVDDYLSDVQDSFTDYDDKVDVVRQEVGSDLGEMSKKTQEVTEETAKLAQEADDLTYEIEEELIAVRNATSAWGSYRDELYKNIEANEKIIEQLREIQRLQMGDVQDYSLFIQEMVDKGYDYNSRIVQEALQKRWDKMGGNDEYNYQEMLNDYINEYANEQGLSFEDAEKALQDDSWYKTLKMLRQYKIERTNWAEVEQNLKAENPNADTSWVQAAREEKLAVDWSDKIAQYVAWNPGKRLDDPYLQELLAVRQAKIDTLADPNSVQSNEEFIKKYLETGTIIDTRTDASQNVVLSRNQTNTEASTATSTTEEQKETTPLTAEQIDQYAEEVWDGKYGNDQARIDNLKALGLTDEDITNIQKRVNQLGEQRQSASGQGKEKEKWAYGIKLREITPPVWIEVSGFSYNTQGSANTAGRNKASSYSVATWVSTFKQGVDELPTVNKLATNFATTNSQGLIGNLSTQDSQIFSNKFATMATGGYTGKWGPEGRLALLHEKELVLNKQDTENFLSATNILRDINTALDKNAFMASLGAYNLQAMTLNNLADQVLQQEVTIHADFPNVTDHTEIEVAIDNLINAASQYAYRS